MIQAYKNYKISNNLCRNTKEKKNLDYMLVYILTIKYEFPNNANFTILYI